VSVSRNEELLKWKEEGSAILAKLETQLAEKLSAIDRLNGDVEDLRVDIAEVRSTLPRSTERASVPTTARSVLQGMLTSVPLASPPKISIATDATIGDVVLGVLAASDAPLAARSVIQEVKRIRPTSDTDVHRALSRLKKSGDIEASGVRPNSLYSMRLAQAALPMTR
jgi:hypothetical protein